MTPAAIPQAVQSALSSAKSAVTTPPLTALKDPEPMPNNWFLYLIVWLCHPILDRNLRPSSVKITVYLLLGIFAKGIIIPTTAILALVAAMFGYTAWKDFMSRTAVKVDSTDAVNLAGKVEASFTEAKTKAETLIEK